MKVLFVIDGLGTGGAERSLRELLPGLVEAGIQPVVACLHRREEGVEEEVLADGFDVRFLEGGTTVSRAARLRRMLTEERPDIVHTAIYRSHLVGRLGSAGRSTVVLSSLVNTPYTPVRLADPNIRWLPYQAVRVADGWTARHLTDHFHAITRAVRDWAVAVMRIPPDRITVIERGRDPSRLGRPGAERRAGARRRLGLRDDDEVLVNAGRQEFQKGQRHLLEAMDEPPLRRPRTVLLIAGRTGAASAGLDQARERSGVGERVRMLGHREDLPDVLAAADVFVFPSLYEGLGGSLIEAMALGLPIVASDIPAVREVVEDGANAVLVRPGDPAALAGAVAGLLDDPARRMAFGRRSRQVFEDRFTLERSTRRTVELYRRLADRGAAQPRVATSGGRRW